MAAVPFPLMSGFHGEEIGRSLVFHSLWEPQQNSVVQLSHPRMIRRPGGKNTGNEHPQILPVCEDVSSLFFSKPSSFHTLDCTWVYMESLPARIDCRTVERISGSCQISIICGCSFKVASRLLLIPPDLAELQGEKKVHLERQFSSAAQRSAYICTLWM